MSFKNIVKQHGHKRNTISRKDERDFEKEIKKQETFEENTKKIFKDMKRCIDAQTMVSKCEAKMVQNLAASSVCGEDPRLQRTLQLWKQAAQRADQLTTELNENNQRTVAEPMKKLSTVFPNVAAAAKKREHLLQEYNKCQAKLDKYTEKERTGSVLVKIEAVLRTKSKKALHSARDEYEAHNNALMEDMPTLFDARIQYIEPSLQALVLSQIKYFQETHKGYAEMEAELVTEKPDLSDDEFSAFIQQKLTDIRALSITADD